VAAGDSAWVVDADSAVDQGLAAGPLAALAASPDGRFVAGFAATGRLTVWTADFGRVLSEFDTGRAGELTGKDLLACGTAAGHRGHGYQAVRQRAHEGFTARRPLSGSRTLRSESILKRQWHVCHSGSFLGDDHPHFSAADYTL